MAVYILRGTRENIFYFDEWSFFLERLGSGTDAFLLPHVEHLALVPVVVYKVLYNVVGPTPFYPYILVMLAFQFATVGLLYVTARKHVGPVLALVPAVVVLTLGISWENLAWPVNMAYIGSLASGLGMFLLLDRESPRADLGAALCLAFALASSSVGVPLAAAALVEVLLSPNRWKRLARVVVVPVGLYGLWQLEYGVSVVDYHNVYRMPGAVFHGLSNSFGAVTGLDFQWGRPMALAFLALIAYRLTRPEPVSRRLWAVLALLVVYWGLTGLTRPQYADAFPPRYFYNGAVILFLVGTEVARGVRLPNRGHLLVGALVLAGVISNLGGLDFGLRFIREASTPLRAELAALEIARPVVAPEYQPDAARAPPITAGRYFPAIDAYGSPAYSLEELARRPDGERQAADRVLWEAFRIALVPSSGLGQSGPLPEIESSAGATQSAKGSCVNVAIAAPVAVIDFVLPPEGLSLRAEGGGEVEVRLRRFAGTFPPGPFAVLEPRTTGTLVAPPDQLATPWKASLRAGRPFTVCRNLPSAASP